MIKKYKVGNVQLKKDRSGTTVALGNVSKNSKYATNIEIIVRDGEGNELARSTNGFLKVENPRTRPGITEEQAAKIPDWIKNELYLVVDDGK